MMIPEPRACTVRAVQAATVAEAKKKWKPRPRLGASSIGDECARKLWGNFHWLWKDAPSWRGIKAADRGHRQEAVMAEELRLIGCIVTAEQAHRQVPGTWWHGGATIDAMVLGLDESPGKWHSVDFKDMNNARFAKLAKTPLRVFEGGKYYSQLQLAMHLFGVQRGALYASKKESDDRLLVRVEYDKAHAEWLAERMEAIVFLEEMPVGVTTNPADQRCKFCPGAGLCHKGEKPLMNCRSCKHSVPIRGQAQDGPDLETLGGEWNCTFHGIPLNYNDQIKGCGDYEPLIGGTE